MSAALPESLADGRVAPLRVLRLVAFGIGVAALLAGERLFPLRRRVEPQGKRVVRNAIIAGLAAVVTNLSELLVVMPLARRCAARRIGLLHGVPLPPSFRFLAGCLLLDYTLYIWHRLNHRVPWLWRFHLPHHVDLDLDTSTGVRFHFGEMALSTIFRSGQVMVFGIAPRTLVSWSGVLLGSVIFHHSNLRLPAALERRLALALVTPRMHGIHHSIIRDETDSNFASMISWWDWLHGTVRLDIPQEAITIGVPAYRDPGDVSLIRVLELPFTKQRDDWRLPDGRISERRAPPDSPIPNP